MEDSLVPIIGFLTAFLSTFIGSFSGGGASLILLPVLLIFAPGSYASLLTVTKTSALVMTGISGKIHASKNSINWPLTWVLIVFGLLGTAIGTYLVQYQYDKFFFEKLLAGVLLFTAAYLVLSKKHGASGRKEREVNLKSLLTCGFWIFLLSIPNGMFGGGGFFYTIFIVMYFRMPFMKTVIYVMISSAVVNFFQTGYLLLTESVDHVLLGFVILGSLIGGKMGTHLQYLKGDLWVKRASITMMTVIGFRMLFDE